MPEIASPKPAISSELEAEKNQDVKKYTKTKLDTPDEDDPVHILDEVTLNILSADPRQQSVVNIRKWAPRLLKLSGFVESKGSDKMKNMWERRPDNYDKNIYFGDPTNGIKVESRYDKVRKSMVPVRRKPRKNQLTEMFSYLVETCREIYKDHLNTEVCQKIIAENTRKKENINVPKKQPSMPNMKQLKDMIEGCQVRLHQSESSVPSEDIDLLKRNISVVTKMFSDIQTLMELTQDTCGSLHNLLNRVEKNRSLTVADRKNCQDFYESFGQMDFINIPVQSVTLLDIGEDTTETKMGSTSGQKTVLNWKIKTERQSKSCSMASVEQPGEPRFQADSVEPVSLSLSSQQRMSIEEGPAPSCVLPLSVCQMNEDGGSLMQIPQSVSSENPNITVTTTEQGNQRSSNYKYLSIGSTDLADLLANATLEFKEIQPQGSSNGHDNLHQGFSIDVGSQNQVTTTMNMQAQMPPLSQSFVEDAFSNGDTQPIIVSQVTENYNDEALNEFLQNSLNPLSTNDLWEVLDYHQNDIEANENNVPIGAGRNEDCSPLASDNAGFSHKRAHEDTSSGICNKKMRVSGMHNGR